MNPMLLKIVSLPINCKIGSKIKALKSGKGNRDFFPIIQKLMNSVQERSLNSPSEPPRAGLPLKKGHFFYLESLRKGLLGKGGPLNKISLNNKDIPVLKKLLCQCGFSQANVENFLKELLQNNPYGEINLSQFFNKITELGPPKRKIYQPITLEPTAIPYLESALRDFGLTPKEAEHVLNAARVEGGGLDLNKFVIKIKGISHKGMPLQNKVKLDQFVKAIEEMVGHSELSKSAAGIEGGEITKGLNLIHNRVKMEEHMTIRLAKQNQLPADVKATIDQILEKVVIANEKDGPQSPLFSFSKFQLTDLHSKKRIGKKGKIKEKGKISAKNGKQKPESLFSSKETKLFSDLDAGKARPLRPGRLALLGRRPGLSPAERGDGGQGFNRGTIEEGNVVKSETRTIDIPQNISSSTFSDLINTVKQNLEPVRDFLPGYLIDQVGKQISRSILRGERIIRLQLKPPELGTLRVEMDMKDNILKLGMITENSSVKELLLSNVYELRESLVQQGVKLERLDVQINYNFNQSLANSKEGLNEEQKWGQDINGVPLIAEDNTEGPLTVSRIMAAGDRLLDLVA